MEAGRWLERQRDLYRRQKLLLLRVRLMKELLGEGRHKGRCDHVTDEWAVIECRWGRRLRQARWGRAPARQRCVVIWTHIFPCSRVHNSSSQLPVQPASRLLAPDYSRQA